MAAAAASMKHEGYIEAPPSDVDLSKAEFILSVGRGVQDKDNLPRFEALADKMGFTFGCSRPIVDAGWLPKAHQVGQSGKVASSCKLYVALGISGAVTTPLRHEACRYDHRHQYGSRGANLQRRHLRRLHGSIRADERTGGPV